MKTLESPAAILAGLGALVLLTEAPASAMDVGRLQEAAEKVTKELEIESLDELPKEAAFEKFIRHAYADLVRWTEPSGKDLSFELRNFVHIPREAFNTVNSTDVVTLPGGDTVVAARVRHRATWTDEVRVMYDPSWTTRKEYLLTQEGQKAATLRLDAALDWGSRDDPRLLELTEITSYEVTVSLDGKDRTYHAAFGWIDREPHSRGISDVETIFWDHVTVGVGETLGETAPMSNREALPRPEGSGPETEGPTAGNVLATKSTCQSGHGSWSGDLSSFLLYQSDHTGHVNGNHAVTGTLAAECECSSTRGQSCTPRLGNMACPETGDTNTCHRTSAPDFDTVSGTVSDTNTQGAADCGGGVACVWKACAGCWCGSLSVSMIGSRSGGGISFTASASDGNVMKQSHDHLCNFGPVVGGDVPDDPRDDDTGGDDGWSGGGGGCQYPCTPIVINLGTGVIRMSGLDDPVQFNMDSDRGDLETVSWTERGSDTAFLALDRDGDAVIGGGYERLRLWFDDDHDGVSQEQELFPLANYAIEAIEVDPVEHRWRDRHGNEFRYSSRVRFLGGGTTRAVDVFLLSGSP